MQFQYTGSGNGSALMLHHNMTRYSRTMYSLTIKIVTLGFQTMKATGKFAEGKKHTIYSAKENQITE
jgi:hypothetical protein